MTPPEVRLWARLKQLRGQGYHFRRQAPFHRYYLDFVCFSRRLIVEVDGAVHTEDRQARHDAVRDRVLQAAGFRVLRIWAREIMMDVDQVTSGIVRVLEGTPHPARFASRPPHEGEGEP